ncbi:MAG: efflux RND transporter permease subunit [Clostridiaceae bacterium]|nr:efflux RND transporter permease subunit [Clostridiaceae bacterium]
MKRIALWEAKHPKIVIAIAIALVIPSIIGFIMTRVNYDIMSYLPDSVESVQGEEILDQTFNNASMSIIVVEKSNARYVAALKEEIEKMDAVSSVIWVNSLADISIPQDVLPDALKDIFYSKSSDSTMMLVQYKYAGSSAETMQTIKNIKTLLSKNAFISGVSAIVEDTKELSDKEAPIYIVLAIVVALVAMSFMMESWLQPFIVLAALGIAIIYNMGTNVFKGEISFITQSIAAILQLGVTMDYSVFLIDRYNEEKLKTPMREEAMANAVTKSFTALIGSSLTTIFGFLALCFMTFTLGLDIGLVMAKGVVFGILTVVLILPELVLIFEDTMNKYKHKSFLPHFEKLNNFVFKYKAVFAVLFVLLLIPAYLLQSKVDLYYSMDKALPQDLISIQGLYKMKNEFQMASTQFVIIDDSIDSGKLTKLENEIENLDGVSSVLSYNKVIGPAIPDDIVPDKILDICKKDGKQLIMVNSVYESASDELNSQIDKMTAIIKSYDPNAIVTGEGAITKDMIVTTNRDFNVTAMLSLIAIFILLAVTFKSISLPVLLILSIELAIWINLSISKLLGAEVSFVGPTVINCIQLGATVDYAVLLTTRFREELHSGLDKKEAILKAANAAERSVFQSAVVFFVATFAVYLVCNISIVKGICSLLARGSVISAASIVFFLMPLLYIFEGVISKTTFGWAKGKKAASVNTENIAKEENQNA